ncbi:hypothetical protein CRX72_21560 [Pantoea sp. BRM17]|nr:hypothetical protein CRX72_21560 [Pantoea sp. BRM17]
MWRRRKRRPDEEEGNGSGGDNGGGDGDSGSGDNSGGDNGSGSGGSSGSDGSGKGVMVLRPEGAPMRQTWPRLRRVNNLGGSGAETLNGITLIEVEGSADSSAFTQEGRIVAGAYDYRLVRGSRDWYLTNRTDLETGLPIISRTLGDIINAGTINLAGSSAGAVLTVNGNYTGYNGLLLFGTELGDDSATSDRLVVTGDVTGTTRVRLSGAGSSMRLSGQYDNAGILQLEEGAGFTSGTFVNDGTVLITGSGTQLHTDTLTNNSTGLIDLNGFTNVGAVEAASGAKITAAALTNNGRVMLRDTGTTLTLADGLTSNADFSVTGGAAITTRRVTNGGTMLRYRLSGTGTLDLNGLSQDLGQVTNDGTVIVSGSASPTVVNMNAGYTGSGRLSVAGENTTLNITGPLSSSRAGVVFDHTGSDYVFTHALTGNGDVAVLSGTTTLANQNSYSGTTSVTGGVLRAGAANALSRNSLTGNMVQTGGRLLLAGGGTLTANTFSLTGGSGSAPATLQIGDATNGINGPGVINTRLTRSIALASTLTNSTINIDNGGLLDIREGTSSNAPPKNIIANGSLISVNGANSTLQVADLIATGTNLQVLNGGLADSGSHFNLYNFDNNYSLDKGSVLNILDGATGNVAQINGLISDGSTINVSGKGSYLRMHSSILVDDQRFSSLSDIIRVGRFGTFLLTGATTHLTSFDMSLGDSSAPGAGSVLVSNGGRLYLQRSEIYGTVTARGY